MKCITHFIPNLHVPNGIRAAELLRQHTRVYTETRNNLEYMCGCVCVCMWPTKVKDTQGSATCQDVEFPVNKQSQTECIAEFSLYVNSEE